MDILDRRIMGGHPISIATSLAMETMVPCDINKVYDKTRIVPTPTYRLSEFRTFYVNINTLFRNIVGSIDRVTFDLMDPVDIITIMEQEIEILTEVVKTESPRTKVIFYYSVFDKLFQSKYKFLFRIPTTEKQLLYATKMKLVCGSVKRNNFSILEEGSCIRLRKNGKTLLLSSNSLDLIQDNISLSLLESHTGVMKERQLFYTKFFQTKKIDLSHIPFNLTTCLIFGSRDIVKPARPDIRYETLDVAKSARWTAITKEPSVVSSIRSRAPDVKELLKTFPKTLRGL